MYSHWATPFQYPAQLLIQGPDTLHGQIVSNTFIIHQDKDIFAVNVIQGHAYIAKQNNAFKKTNFPSPVDSACHMYKMALIILYKFVENVNVSQFIREKQGNLG